MNRFKSHIPFALGLLAVLAFPAGAAAQLSRDVPLSRVVYQLYLDEITSLQEALDDAGFNVDVSLSDLEDAQALSRALGAQLSSFPLGSSAGAFTWTFDPNIGAFARASQSFGPIFSERALTIGAKKINFGINFQRATFDDYEGLDLDTGDIAFYNEIVPNRFYSKGALTLDVSSNTVGFFLNYGVTDRFDVGLALPLVTVNLKASLASDIVDQTGRPGTTIPPLVTTGGRSKSGFGDIVLRAKYNLVKQPGGGVAAGFDWRLPTGDEDNLLGIPGTQYKLFGVYSTTFGRFNPHANIGYTFSNGNKATPADSGNPVLFPPPDEFNYTAGVDVTVYPKLTLAGDIVGRTLRDFIRLEVGDPFGLGPSFYEFVSSDQTTLNSVLGSVGVKYNLWGNLLLTGNVLFPLTDGGLRDKFTPLIGIDYSF